MSTIFLSFFVNFVITIKNLADFNHHSHIIDIAAYTRYHVIFNIREIDVAAKNSIGKTSMT